MKETSAIVMNVRMELTCSRTFSKIIVNRGVPSTNYAKMQLKTGPPVVFQVGRSVATEFHAFTSPAFLSLAKVKDHV